MRHTALALVSLVGVLVLLGGCPPPPDSAGGEAVGVRPEPPTPQEAPTPPAAAPEASGKVSWFYSLDEGLKRSKLLSRPVLVDFYADWCGPCKMLDAQTWPDPAVAQETERFVCVKLNVDENQQRADQFGVTAVPTIAVVSPQGRIIGRSTGYLDPRDMVRFLRRYH